jgi:putative transposase
VPIAAAAAAVSKIPETQGVITTTTSGNVNTAHTKEGRMRLISIDPGMRTFGTCYDPDGVVTEWAEGSKHLVLLFRLNRKAGRIETRATKINGRKKRRLVAVASRIRKRSIDLVNELHRKFAIWLCQNHDVVLLPKFDTRSIVRKRSEKTGKWTRKIGKKTAGAAMRLAHYRFRNFLLHKANEFGTKIEICDEQYTSKTCGACGVLNETLGSAKTFSCKKCGYIADRDHNAARNILLRYLAINDIKLEGVSCTDTT